MKRTEHDRYTPGPEDVKSLSQFSRKARLGVSLEHDLAVLVARVPSPHP